MKHNQNLNKWILHIVFGLMAFSSLSQDLYDHKLDKEKWSEIRDNIRYEGRDGAGREWTYESQEEYERARRNKGNGNGKGSGSGDGNGGEDVAKSHTTPQKVNPPQWNPSTPNLASLSWLGWLFIIIFGAAIIGLIVYLVMNNKPNVGNKKVDLDDYYEDVAPADIPLTELQKRLKEALDKGDYRGAVRIYYLFILKDLSEKQWIFWEKEKTNMHYLREMGGKPEFDDFNKSISYFEVIWYGKRQIDQNQFQTIQPNFTNLLQKLGVN